MGLHLVFNSSYYGIINTNIIPGTLGKGGSNINDILGGESSKIYADESPAYIGINNILSKGNNASGYTDVFGGICIMYNTDIKSGAGGGGYTSGSAGGIFNFYSDMYAMGGGGGKFLYNYSYIKLIESRLASNLSGFDDAGKSGKKWIC